MRPGAKLIELIEEHKVTLGDLQSSSDTEEIIILKRPKRGDVHVQALATAAFEARLARLEQSRAH
jgi:hypothetical protein